MDMDQIFVLSPSNGGTVSTAGAPIGWHSDGETWVASTAETRTPDESQAKKRKVTLNLMLIRTDRTSSALE